MHVILDYDVKFIFAFKSDFVFLIHKNLKYILLFTEIVEGDLKWNRNVILYIS